MFNKNKNSFIKLEIIGDDLLVESNLRVGESPAFMTMLINNLLSRELLPNVLDSLLDRATDKNQAREIINGIVEVQNSLEIKPKSRRRRNPLIRPTQVFKVSDEEGEE